jgi:hypothetical protein
MLRFRVANRTVVWMMWMVVQADAGERATTAISA